jgi:DNA-binding XRE family transcriptional regulator
MGLSRNNDGIEFDFGKDSFKINTTRRFLNRKISAAAFAKEVGVTIKTLYNWAHEYDMFVPMNKLEMSLIQKMKIIITFEALPENERGEFLRKKGLFDSDIQTFKTEISKADDKSEEKKNVAIEAMRNDLRETQKALKKTEKALTEANAIIELKKKLDILFGSEEEDPKPPLK